MDYLTQLTLDQESEEAEEAPLAGSEPTGPPAAAREARRGHPSAHGGESSGSYEGESARYDRLLGLMATGNGPKVGELLAEWQAVGWLRDWRSEENLTLYADAITDGYLDIINVLLSFSIPLGDALIRAIDVAFDDAIKTICRHLGSHEDIRAEVLSGTSDNDDFHPAITPLILAAQRNDFGTVKLLLDLGATIDEPSMSQGGDVTLTQAISTLHVYRALSRPAYILATQTDVFGHAFEMSAKLNALSRTWEDFGAEYEQMARGVEVFAGELLGESSSTEEILGLFRYHNTDKYRDVQGKQHPLAKLFEAIDYQQKEFIAHPHSQKAIIVQFYRGLLDWNERGLFHQVLLVLMVSLGYPVICLLYIFVPTRRVVQFARLPYVMMMMKAGSGFTFLLFIVIVTVSDKHDDPAAGGVLHGFMLVWILGLAWLHIKTIGKHGCSFYVGNSVNLHELTIMVLYFTVSILRWNGESEVPDDNPAHRSVSALHDLQGHVTSAAVSLRAKLNDSLVTGVDGILLKVLSGCRARGLAETAASGLATDAGSPFRGHLRELEETMGLGALEPAVVAGALFGVTITVSVLRLLNLLLVSDSVGPLRISLGNMTVDILKFCGIFMVIWIAFAIGLFQNFYSAGQAATRACIAGGEDPASCQVLVGFSSFLSSVKDLYWSLYGFIGTDVLELPGRHSVAEGVGTFLFIGYLIVAVLVLLNALIGMLSNTYNLTEEHADMEWKFHRAAVWASYLRPVGTLPPPFNLVPSLKTLYRALLVVIGLKRKAINRKKVHATKELDDYDRVLQLVSQRYIQANLSTESQNNENARPRDLQTLRNDIVAFKFSVQDRLKHLGGVLDVTNDKTSTVRHKLEDLRPLDARAEAVLDQSSRLTDNAATLFDETGTLRQTQDAEISDRDQDAARMRDAIAKLRGEMADLVSSHLAEMDRRDRLEAGLNQTILELNGTVAGLRDEMGELETKHTEELTARDLKEEQLSETIHGLREDAICLTDKVQTLNQARDDLENKAMELRDKVGELESRQAEERKARDGKEEELTDTILHLREENKCLTDKVQALGQEKADLEERMAELSKSTSPSKKTPPSTKTPSTLNYTIAAHKVEMQKLTGSHAKEMSAKQREQSKLDKTIGKLQEENRTLKDHVAQLGDDIARSEKECSELRDGVVALQFRIEELKGTHKGELRAKHQRNSKLEDDIGRLQKENTDLKDSISEIDEDKTSMARAVDRLRREVEELHAESATLRREAAALQEEIGQLTSRHSAELADRDQERENLRELNTRLHVDVSSLEDSLCGLRQERNHLLGRVKELGEETDELRQRSSGLEDTAAALRAELEETASGVEEMKGKELVIRGLQEERSSLLGSLQRLKEDKAELASLVGDLNMELVALGKERRPTAAVKENAGQIQAPPSTLFEKITGAFGNSSADSKKGPQSGNDTAID